MKLICLQGAALESTDTVVTVNRTLTAALLDWHRHSGLQENILFDVYDVSDTPTQVRPRLVVEYTQPIDIENSS